MDALNFTLLIEKNLTERFRTLDPCYSIPDPNTPYGISNYLTLLSPGHTTMANFMLDQKEDIKNDTIVSRL